jgi:hypothetical protein
VDIPFFVQFSTTAKMVRSGLIAAFAAYAHVAQAACPYMDADSHEVPASHPQIKRADGSNAVPASTDEFMAQFEVNDTDVYMTTNTGTPIEDLESLSAGERGPTLLEDFVFREKIMHFGTMVELPSRRKLIETQITKGFPSELFTLAVLVLMVCLQAMAIGRTSPLPRS